MNDKIYRFADFPTPACLRDKMTEFFNGKKLQPSRNGIYRVKVKRQVIHTKTRNGETRISSKKTHVQFYFSRFENGTWYCAANYIHTAEIMRQPSVNQNRDWQGLTEEVRV